MPPIDSVSIRLSWEKFVEIAVAEIKRRYPTAGQPRFMKDYGPYEGAGKMYDFPSSVEFDLEGEEHAS